MQRNSMVAKRYAEALFDLTTDKNEKVFFGAAPKIFAELKMFSSAVEAVGANEFFLSPVIKVSEKTEVLESIKDKLPLTHLFFLTLIEGGRMNCVSEIVEEFNRLCDEASGELTVDLQLAHSLSPQLVEEIKSVLQEQWQRQIKIKQKINPEIIGGFVATAPGRIMDASVASQLENLEHQVFV